MERWKDKVAVVTGASRGIGRGIAEALLENGLKVVAIARDVESLTEIEGKFYPTKADLRNEEDVIKAFAWILETLGPVHVLVNNAGYFPVGPLIDGNSKFWKDIFDLNVIGLCIATREAIEHMVKHNIDGHIVHINSMLGHQVVTVPPLNVYPASKHAVTALTETLRQELNSINSNIKITDISPGPTDTDIVRNLKLEMTLLKPEDLGDAVCYALGTPPHVQISKLTIEPIQNVLF